MSRAGWDKGFPNLRSSLFLLKLGIAVHSLKVHLTDQLTDQYHSRRGLGLRQGLILKSRAIDAGGGRKTSPFPTLSPVPAVTPKVWQMRIATCTCILDMSFQKCGCILTCGCVEASLTCKQA